MLKFGSSLLGTAHSVTDGHHQVRRRIELKLEDGQNIVEVQNLPSCIDADSVRVDGIGRAVILDVIFRACIMLVSGSSPRDKI